MKSLLTFLSFFAGATSFSQTFSWVNNPIDTNYRRWEDMEVDKSSNSTYMVYDLYRDPGAPVGEPHYYYYETTIRKISESGETLWEKVFPVSGGDLVVASDGTLRLTAFFTGTIDVDPGPGVSTISCPVDTMYAVLLSLDANGDVLWTRQFGTWGEWNNVASPRIRLDVNDNCYFFGSTYDTSDMDPGPGEFLIEPGIYPLAARYLLKLDQNGDFVWCWNTGLTTDEFDIDMVVHSDGRLDLLTQFVNSLELDPDPAVANTVYTNGPAFAIRRFDPTGDLLWSKTWDPGSDETGQSYLRLDGFALDGDENLYCMGAAPGQMDFDPTAAEHLAGETLDHNFIIKLDSAGNLAKATVFQNTGWTSLYMGLVDFDPVGNMYVAGSYQGNCDIDPSPTAAATIYNGNPGYDLFLMKLDTALNYVWNMTIPGNHNQMPRRLLLDSNGHFLLGAILVSTAGPIDVDPGPDEYFVSGDYNNGANYLLKFLSDRCNDFGLTLDSVAQTTCSAPGAARAIAFGGVEPYNYSWSPNPMGMDSLLLVDSGGVYRVTVTEEKGCLRKLDLLLEGPESMTGTDLKLDLSPTGLRPGVEHFIFVNAVNTGCVAIDAVLKVVVDSELQYLGADPAPDMIQDDTLIWLLPDFSYDSDYFQPVVHTMVPATAALGDEIRVWGQITPLVGDIEPENNTQEVVQQVFGSYDPNDIAVSPEGNCVPHYVEPTTELTYKIRFQNTGTAEAYTVVVTDTLDADLDRTTLRIEAYSHDCWTELVPGNIVRFHFDNIHLPDSAADLAGSNGFVTFSISPKSDVEEFTSVHGQAGIYFDFNEPVITNEVFNTLASGQTGSLDTLGVEAIDSYVFDDVTYTTPGTYTHHFVGTNGCDSTVVLNLSLEYLGVDQGKLAVLKVFPNPAAESVNILIDEDAVGTSLQLVTLTGQIVVEKTLETAGLNTISVSGLRAGIYLLRLKEGDSVRVIRVEKI